ncbi:MAG TPA: undecaprenyl-phosphate glucose phosphotransferase [Aggregatilineales bacterium]|nr:undecaprenyl-phosphate glucose phosphotransferase [Chloroflexota bacterium]HOA22768.1 undecaprenyl-phosphate glucose phosphotransferase [Aggregatilineales bacterium]HQE19936.1 undecaprenyl-phosphate glucose phosphotransferase [Aggregatilineales bacterium]
MSRQRVRTLYIVSKIALDALMTLAAFVIAFQLRRLLPFPSQLQNAPGFAVYVPMMVVQVISVLAVFYFNKLYHVTRASSRLDELSSIIGAVSIGTMISVAISALTFKNTIFELDFPRAMVLYAWLLSVVLIAIGRESHRRLWHRLRMHGFGRDRVLVVGSGESARAIIQKIQWSPYLGYELVGVVNGHEPPGEVAGVQVLGKADDLPAIIEKYDIQEVIIAPPEGTSRHEIVRLVSLSQRGSVAIKIFPDMFEFVTTGVSIDDLGGLPLLNVRDIQLRGWRLSLKRAMDLIGASIGLVLLSPFMLLMALLIKLDSPGPVFYYQERMGLDGRPFQMFKFRSMRQDAEEDGPGWTTKDDPRRTRIGALLRSKNIDELPQLINVLLGDMSLVGPRPERPIYVEKFRNSIPRYMERHREKAGMTGWAQVNGLRGDTSIAERTKYDLWYVENWSLWLDIKIIVRTIVQTLFGNAEGNAY